MAPAEKHIDIFQYVKIGMRRKWYIIFPLVLSLVVSVIVYRKLPKIYMATTLILVEPQGVSEHYVQSTITDPGMARVNTITREILSRTNLERVIKNLNLYQNMESPVSMEQIVEWMRKSIEVRLEVNVPYYRGENCFSISYEGTDPKTVMMVTNKLASQLIEEKRRVREQQVGKASDILAKEVEEVEKRLRQKEIHIRKFKEQNMGELPNQWSVNLSKYEQLQEELRETGENIRSAEDKASLLKSQIEDIIEREQTVTSRAREKDPVSGLEEMEVNGEPEDPLIVQYKTLTKDLAAARLRYTESHPDVIELRKKIADLEPKVKEVLGKQRSRREARLADLKHKRESAGSNSVTVSLSNSASESLLAQYTDQYNASQLEVKRLKEVEKRLKEQILLYRQKISVTPRLEQELALLSRDYDLLRASYQSLLEKKIQAQMAEELERRQGAQNFRVLDTARLPERPVKPVMAKILLIGLLVGLAAGIGLTWLRESLDQSFRTVSEVESDLELPVIATIPNLKEKEKRAA